MQDREHEVRASAKGSASWLCCLCLCSFRSISWVIRSALNRDYDGEPVRPFRRFLIYLTFFIFCIYLYFNNFAYFCHATHQPRGTTRVLIFSNPALEGSQKIEREGFMGEFWVAAEDLYLTHVVCNTMANFRPTHIVILGDLFSYQYLDFQEFSRRSRRLQSIFNISACMSAKGLRPLLLNVSGNSDIGFGLEMSRSTVTRVEQAFGKVNAEVLIPGHVMVQLNSLNLDPATDHEMRKQTWSLLDSVHERRLQNDLNVILFQHLPFSRPASHCDENVVYRTTKDRFTVEQSHVSAPSTQAALNLSRPVLIFSAHQPEGCYYQHPMGSREYTVRSVTSDYGGHSMVLDIYESQRGTFKYHVTSCSFVTMRSFYVVMALMVAWVSLVSLLVIELVATSDIFIRLAERFSQPSSSLRSSSSSSSASSSSPSGPSVAASFASSLAARFGSSARKPKSFVRKNV